MEDGGQDDGESIGKRMGENGLRYDIVKRLKIEDYPRADGKPNISWMAHRLAFLWDLRDEKTALYLELHLGEEKQEIYEYDHGVTKLAEAVWR